MKLLTQMKNCIENRVWSFLSFHVIDWIFSFPFGFYENLRVILSLVPSWSLWLVSSCCEVRDPFVCSRGTDFPFHHPLQFRLESKTPFALLLAVAAPFVMSFWISSTAGESFLRVRGSTSHTGANAQHAAAGLNWERTVSLQKSDVIWWSSLVVPQNHRQTGFFRKDNTGITDFSSI